MASAFSNSLMASGVGNTPPPKISEITKGMTIEFLADIGIDKEAQNKKDDIAGPVCKLHTKIPKTSTLGNATFRYANFTKFCSIVNIDVRKE